MKWFTSDIHAYHRNIVKYTNRGVDTTQEQHDEWLVDLWNSQVKPGHICYHLGDFSFHKDAKKTLDFIDCLNGQIVMIKGNHDHSDMFKEYAKHPKVIEAVHYKEMKVAGVNTVLFHFPIAVFHRQHHGAWHLHGHCMDEKTEVLTDSGFKFHNELISADLIATLNLNTNLVEYQNYSQKHEFIGKYVGYEYSGKSVSFHLTDKHRFVYKPYHKNDFCVKEIDLVKGNVSIPVCGENGKQDFPLTDDQLRLYVHICTDGSYASKSLIRFHLKKERKILELVNLLNRLNIKFSNNVQKSGTTKINFYKPDYFSNLEIKPLDRKLLKNLSARQVNLMLETYSITDGCKTGQDSIQISTAKVEEANLLQEVLTTSGFCCNMITRVRGKYTNYVLSVNTRKFSIVNSKKFVKNEFSGYTWCLTVPNGTLIVRREGKVHVTGNSHGNYNPLNGKVLDVGLDSAYNVLGKHRFFNEEDIAQYMETRPMEVLDHHTVREGDM